MLKQIISIVFALLCFAFLSSGFYFLSAQIEPTPTPSEKYELPYPGILPDHPFYFVKAIRDRILDITARDNIKKAQLRLLLSDKRLAMAQALAKKGKNKLAIDTLSKGEKYFLSIPQLVKDAKTQGNTPPIDLVIKLQSSNRKHREVENQLARDMTQADATAIEQIITLNDQTRDKLSSWK